MNIGAILHQLPESDRKVIRKKEKLLKKVIKTKYAIVFNQTCLKEDILPAYTHTHTHTHIYIYIYIYIYIQKYTQYTHICTTQHIHTECHHFLGNVLWFDYLFKNNNFHILLLFL